LSSRLRNPLSLRVRNPNCSQEAGCMPARFTAKMHNMESLTATLAFFRLDPGLFRIARRLLPFILLVVQWIVARTLLQAAVVATPRVTLIVFGDKPMPEEEWTALKSALAKGFDGLALETHFVPVGFEIVRGESLAPGVQFESAIPLFLHGSCRLVGEPSKGEVVGPLGWVLRDQGKIQPFIHVDCARIAAMLAQRALWMNQGARNDAMAEAISRVVLHEWVHIATQNPAHTRDGIEKRSFGLQDLMPGYSQILPNSGGK
jgi:hypothetical protein